MTRSFALTVAAALAVAVLTLTLIMNPAPACADDTGATPGPYRHVVLLKFKAGADAAKVRQVTDAFRALKEKLPAIRSLEWGTNVSPEGLDQGFTHCFTLTFTDKNALEKQYLHEPAHKEFGALLGPVLDKVLVFDYVAQ